MRRWLRRVGIALLALLLLGAGFIAIQWQRRPALEVYAPLTLPEASTASLVRVRFAGVATLLFDDGETAWMTDGFFSRPPLSSLAFSKIGPDDAAIDRELKHLGVTRLAAVVPVHSHYDHAMDSPRVAQRTGALLIGSASTLNIGRGLGLAEDRMREVKPGEIVRLGKFKLTFIASRHSPTLFTDGNTPETVDTPLVPPARAMAWREGQTWSLLVEHASGTRMLVQGSAGYVRGVLKGRQADTVFLGVGTLGTKSRAYREKYWNEVVKTVGAKRVIPIHWDAFWLPLTEPLQAMPMLVDDFGASMDDPTRLGPRDGARIRMAPTFTPFAP